GPERPAPDQPGAQQQAVHGQRGHHPDPGELGVRHGAGPAPGSRPAGPRSGGTGLAGPGRDGPTRRGPASGGTAPGEPGSGGSPVGQPVTRRTASRASTAQVGTTRKNSASSTGRPPGSTSPRGCAGSKDQGCVEIAWGAHPVNSTNAGSTARASRPIRRYTRVPGHTSSQDAPSRQPASTAR